MSTEPRTFITTLDASRLLHMSPDRVRQLERCGELPAQRTSSGVRLFDRATVLRYAQTRERAR